MKSFFKKLAFVMALAMVVSMVAPAGSAFAAETGVKIQNTKTIVKTYELDKAGATVDFAFEGCTTWSEFKNTDKWGWTSSNEAVATVDKAGVVTAVAAGTATITITVGDDYKESVEVTVKKEEVKGAFEITQINTNTVTLAFDKAPAKADLEAGLAFNLVIEGVPVTLPVNTVEVKDNVATVTVFNTFVDGEEYSFVYGEDSVSFVASVGEIDRVEFWYFTGEDETKNVGVAYVNEEDGEDFETNFRAKLFDANNVDITAKYDLDDDLEIRYELINESDAIELDEEEGVITFDAVAAAAVKMVVTWEDKDAEEHSKEYTGVVVAEKLPEIALEYVNSGFIKLDDFIADAEEAFATNHETPFWNGTIGLNSSYTLGNDGDYKFAALFNDNRGNKVVSGTDEYAFGTFSYQSSNDDVLDIDSDGELSFYEAGSAYILVYFTPDSDDEDVKPVFVGSKKLTVSPARYATSFKVVSTSIETASNALVLYTHELENGTPKNDNNYNRVKFEVQVLDQTGAAMGADFSSYFEIEGAKEENPELEVVYDADAKTHFIYVDGDDYTLEDGKDYQKFKYELSIEKEDDAEKVTTKPVTLTVKVEDNAAEVAELAKFLAVDSFNGTAADATAAKSFNITGWKGGYPINLVVKQTNNYKYTDGDTQKSVKLGWATELRYVDDNGYVITKIPSANFTLYDKDVIETGEAGKVYYTIDAPKNAANWSYTVTDGGVVFQWNNANINDYKDYYDKTATFEEYATTGKYTVTYYAVKKDGGKLYEKGSYTFDVSNSQTAPTFAGFAEDMDNYTELPIPVKSDAMDAADYAELDAIVQAHLVFKHDGVVIDWDKYSIDWTESDYTADGEKLRIKKLCINVPLDRNADVERTSTWSDATWSRDYSNATPLYPTFKTMVSVNKNIRAEE